MNATPVYDRLADLEALREVTEQLVVALDPYLRQQWAAKAETILRRLREDKPAPTLRDIEEGRATSLREPTTHVHEWHRGACTICGKPRFSESLTLEQRRMRAAPEHSEEGWSR